MHLDHLIRLVVVLDRMFNRHAQELQVEEVEITLPVDLEQHLNGLSENGIPVLWKIVLVICFIKLLKLLEILKALLVSNLLLLLERLP